MNKVTIFLWLFSLLVFFATCKGQAPTPSNESNENEFGIEFLKNNPLITDVDTLFSQNAPSSITRNILQDKNGIMWFATFDGIIKYDGQAFTNVTKDISKSRFFSIIEDKKGMLWFGSIGDGIFRYDGKSFKHFTTDNGLVNNRVTNIYEATDGIFWIGTTDGLSIYDGESFKNYTTENGLPYTDVNAIVEDIPGQYWMGTRDYALNYDGKTFSEIKNDQDDRFGNVRKIIKDSKGHIWLGGKNGLWRYDGSTYKKYTSDFVGHIYEDRQGNIWTSSEELRSHGWALSRYDVISLENQDIHPIKVKTGEGMFFGILEDEDGNIWAGTLNGVYRYDGNKITTFHQ